MTVFTTSEVPGHACLQCGVVLDHATAPGVVRPVPGSISVCIRCGHVMAFADDLSLRVLTPEETVEMATDTRVVTLRAQIARRRRADAARMN